jgi:hypothetical protein
MTDPHNTITPAEAVAYMRLTAWFVDDSPTGEVLMDADYCRAIAALIEQQTELLRDWITDYEDNAQYGNGETVRMTVAREGAMVKQDHGGSFGAQA